VCLCALLWQVLVYGYTCLLLLGVVQAAAKLLPGATLSHHCNGYADRCIYNCMHCQRIVRDIGWVSKAPRHNAVAADACSREGRHVLPLAIPVQQLRSGSHGGS
jgi:hypothetical protein